MRAIRPRNTLAENVGSEPDGHLGGLKPRPSSSGSPGLAQVGQLLSGGLSIPFRARAPSEADFGRVMEHRIALARRVPEGVPQ
jgi:hypothetical protein